MHLYSENEDLNSDYKPFLIAWNLTKRCNLCCEHCYLSAGERGSGSVDELSTEECFKIIDDLREVNPALMLVLTGGEPLLRRDLTQIARYASNKGIMVVVGTNGTYLDRKRIQDLREAGVMGISISIDSLDHQKHDSFRALSGALEGALKGVDVCALAGMPFQIHTTVSRMNFDEVPEIMEFAYRNGARVFNVFFMVCTGRGEAMSDISPEQYEQMLGWLVDIQKNYPGMFVRSRCAPHYKRIAFEKDPDSPVTKAQGYEGGGCLAGTHYARITPEGDLTPCPFMPVQVGNLRMDSFSDLWNDSPVFKELRQPRLKGKCGSCEYEVLCGGCRARPYASHGDYLDEDLWCLYTPKEGPKILPLAEEALQVIWAKDAEERLEKLPFFLRKMIRGRVERHAMESGLGIVTVELMDKLRRQTFGDARPIFKNGRFKGLSHE